MCSRCSFEAAEQGFPPIKFRFTQRQTHKDVTHLPLLRGRGGNGDTSPRFGPRRGSSGPPRVPSWAEPCRAGMPAARWTNRDNISMCKTITPLKKIMKNENSQHRKQTTLNQQHPHGVGRSPPSPTPEKTILKASKSSTVLRNPIKQSNLEAIPTQGRQNKQCHGGNHGPSDTRRCIKQAARSRGSRGSHPPSRPLEHESEAA